jgi:argininosuccinate lyase
VSGPRARRFPAIGEGTRLRSGPAEELARYFYTPLALVGPRYFAAMSRVNMAHVVMLTEQGMVARDVGARLLRELRAIDALGVEKFPVEPASGDLYTSVEGYLIERLGAEVGGYLQLARSRADLHAAVDRLVVRDALCEILAALLDLRGAALDVAARHLRALIPSYTFQQHAQVMSFGHYLAGWHDAWSRDTERLFQAYTRADASVLGALIGSGSGWPVDRELTRRLLGHRGLAENAKDAIWDGDFILEAHAVCAVLIARHLRFVLDYYQWTSYEFRLIELDDSHAGSSSIMPQKKNPYALIALRNKCTTVLAELQRHQAMAALGAYRADILGLNLPPVTAGLRETAEILDLSAHVVRRSTFNADRGAELAGANFATVTELVDTLVRVAGLSYRSAHQVIGVAVKTVLEQGTGTGGITSSLLDEAARQALGRTLGLPEKDVRAALDPLHFVESRATRGGTSPAEVERMAQARRSDLARDQARLAELRAAISEGDRALRCAVDAIAGAEGP